jgi:molybdopterin converting factor small subunit
MKVLIPDLLAEYTGTQRVVDAHGGSLAEALADLDRHYPGIRFRMIDEQDAIRRHMRIFVNGDEVRTLDVKLADSDEVFIIQALSGG